MATALCVLLLCCSLQVMRPRPDSPLSYASMSQFIAPLFLDQVLQGNEVVREVRGLKRT
jgi:hypothetical protein